MRHIKLFEGFSDPLYIEILQDDFLEGLRHVATHPMSSDEANKTLSYLSLYSSQWNIRLNHCGEIHMEEKGKKSPINIYIA